MREPEGIEIPRPGRSLKTPWSRGRDLDIRSVAVSDRRERFASLLGWADVNIVAV
jgi:hypothetical protein